MEPFIGSAAVRRGDLTRRGLARDFDAVYRDVYLARGVEMTALLRARAAWLATGAPLVGLSAAALHGTKWLDPAAPAEVVRSDRHAVTGIVAHTWALDAGELGVVGGIPVTTPARTAFDVGRTRTAARAIPLLDALLNTTRIATGDVLAVADAHPGFRGVASLRTMLADVDGGAESPQETRLRLLLVSGGLPRPETQIRFAALRIRVDMGWRTWKVAVEYDGAQHWTDPRQRAWDIERLALLEAAGWSVVRVSATMLGQPWIIVERVRQKLRERGCPI